MHITYTSSFILTYAYNLLIFKSYTMFAMPFASLYELYRPTFLYMHVNFNLSLSRDLVKPCKKSCVFRYELCGFHFSNTGGFAWFSQ